MSERFYTAVIRVGSPFVRRRNSKYRWESSLRSIGGPSSINSIWKVYPHVVVIPPDCAVDRGARKGLMRNGFSKALRAWQEFVTVFERGASMHSNRLPMLRGLSVFAMLSVTFCLAGLPQAFGQVNILTNKMDNPRTGQNSNETFLTLSNVNSNQFGKLSTFNVDGYIQAQPLYMSALTINGGTHNVVFVATLHNSVYAIDADTGVQLWQVNLGPSVGSTQEGCSGVTGFNEIGILSTPVIDPLSNTLYLTSKTFVSSTASAYSLHALDITTGLEKFGAPVPISATIGTLTFTPLQQIQRPALLLSNGTIYIAFGSNGCDFKARGWLFAYNASNLQQSAVMTMQPDNSYGSSIWQGGVGPAADGAGNVYLSTANGIFDYGAFDLGDSVLKLSLGPGAFTVDDYFTPFDQGTMADNDIDLGSGGVTLLPYQTGSSTPDLLVTSGKDADIYLINTNSLGQYNPTGNTQIPQYLQSALAGEFFGNPVYWNNSDGTTNGTVYFLAHQDYLRSYSLSVNSSGNSVLTPITQTVGKLTTIGLPVVSSNGANNGIVWLVRNVKNVPLMSAYDALHLFLLYDSSMAAGGRDTLGTIGHFATPIVANGKLYAGTQSQLVTYGLFQQINPTAGSGQTGTAGSTLPIPITVVASNPYTGAPISGLTVTFSDGGKKGKFSNTSAVTDSNGQASSTYTLPNLAQTVAITVSSPGFASAFFSEQGIVGPIASLSVVSGSKQSGTVGTTLPLPIVVKAKDAVGNPVVGASVSFTDGLDGKFSPVTAITGSNGQASTTYTLPTTAKASITVTASVGSVSVKITEQAVAGPPATVKILQGNNQTAHVHNKLPQTLIVAVVDQYGNGLAGLTVNFTDNGAGGTFSNPNPVTTTTGRASTTYTTPSVTGTVTIDATYGTLPPAVFTETVD